MYGCFEGGYVWGGRAGLKFELTEACMTVLSGGHVHCTGLYVVGEEEVAHITSHL